MDLEKINMEAEGLANLGKLEESIVLYKSILAEDPFFSEANLSMGNISFSINKKETAVYYYANAALYNDDSRDAIMNLCYTLIEVGDNNTGNGIMDVYLANNFEVLNNRLMDISKKWEGFK